MALTAQPFWITHGLNATWEVKQLVASGTTASIDRGTPTKKSTTNVALCATGDGTTASLFTGFAKNASNETSTAAGSVETWMPTAAVEYRGADKTSTNSNTQALIDALMHKRIKFDLTGTVWTVDSGIADATANCIMITGGDYHTSQLTFIYMVSGSMMGNTTT